MKMEVADHRFFIFCSALDQYQIPNTDSDFFLESSPRMGKKIDNLMMGKENQNPIVDSESAGKNKTVGGEIFYVPTLGSSVGWSYGSYICFM